MTQTDRVAHADLRIRPAVSSSSHIQSLDGIRAASIIFVLMAHTLPLGPKDWALNVASGRFGMALFFCLSGYLITSMLYRSPAIRPFLIRRLCRIIPAVWLYLVVLLVFFDLPWQAFVRNMLFVQNYLVAYQTTGPISHLWSLAVEIHFYLAVALAVWLGGRKALWLIPPAAVIVTGLRIDLGVVSNINTHLRVDEILAGGCLALIVQHWGDTLRRWFAHDGLAAGIWTLLLILLAISSHDQGGWLTYLRPYFSMALVGVTMHCGLRPLLQILESRVAAYIARISYALYIYHPLMIWGVMNAGSSLERYLIKRPVSYALTLAAAHLSTFFWEARWQTIARNWTKAAH